MPESRSPMSDFRCITRNQTVMGGRPCIRGIRVTVDMIVGQVGAGRSVDDLLSDYPYLQREDILEALRYAAWCGGEIALSGNERTSSST